MRLTSRIAAATVLVAVGQSAAGQVEEILVVEKKQAGWIAWQTDLDTYCAKFAPDNRPPWCGGNPDVGGPGQPNYPEAGQPCNGTENVSAGCRCTGSTPQKVCEQW